jgi:putative MATE family efflux protein
MKPQSSLVDQPTLFKPILLLAWPVFLEQLLVLMVGLVDTLLTGWYLQTHHMAAMGQMAYLLWMIPALMSVVSIGTTAVVAREIGGGDRVKANLVTNQALVVGFCFSMVMLGSFWFGSNTLLTWLQLSDEAQVAASLYLRWIIPIIPLMAFQQIGVAALRGSGNTVSGLWVMGTVNIVNTLLSFLLVSGSFGFPNYGWEGLAIGTAAGYVVGSGLVAWGLLSGTFGLSIQRAALYPNRTQILRILRVGLPGGTDMMATVFCHLWFVGIINSLGTLAAAAHGLAIRVEAIAYAPGTAFQVAAATLAGQFLGAKQSQRASQAIWITCGLSCLTLSLAVVLFWTSSETVVGLFVTGRDQQLVQESATLLRIVSLGLIPLAIVLVFSGALRGAGDTQGPLAITFICFVLIRIPLTYGLACAELPWLSESWRGLGWGVQGAWCAMVSDLIVRATLLTARFLHGKWKTLKV